MAEEITALQISPAGHKLMADLAIAFIDNQLCELDHEDEEIPLPELPPVSAALLIVAWRDIDERGTETTIRQVGSAGFDPAFNARMLLDQRQKAPARTDRADRLVSPCQYSAATPLMHRQAKLELEGQGSVLSPTVKSEIG